MRLLGCLARNGALAAGPLHRRQVRKVTGQAGGAEGSA
ncbi:MAG: hypothetical protein JWP39_1483, partial [Jatrophihabitans sp.]|nr:hypothetical protein [Jatrophihabitans sp.]